MPPADLPGFLCVGAAHWDLIGRTDAPLPPGADVPGRVTRQPGGVAQNIARALAGLGRRVGLLAAVGTDPDGDRLAADLAAAGVETAWLHRHDGPTDSYLAIETAGGALHAAIADCTGLERVGPALLAPLAATPDLAGTIVADGNLPPALLAQLAARRSPLAFVPASPHKLAAAPRALCAPHVTLYLNRTEAEALAGRSFSGSAEAARAVLALGAGAVVVTDGPGPASAADAGGPLVTRPAAAAVPATVTGAGDAVVAHHLAARADGLPAAAALDVALAAARRHIGALPP